MNTAASYPSTKFPSVPAFKCETCRRVTARDELVRHQGECFSCSTERETRTLILDQH